MSDQFCYGTWYQGPGTRSTWYHERTQIERKQLIIILHFALLMVCWTMNNFIGNKQINHQSSDD